MAKARQAQRRIATADARTNARPTATLLQQAVDAHRAGQQDEARRHYGQVLLIDPDNADALQLLGVLQHQSGESEAGLRNLRRAAELQPDNAYVRNNLGGVLKELGRPEEAEREFAAAIALSPGYVEALANRAIALRDLKRPDEAITAFQAVLAVDPAHAESLRRLAQTCIALQRFAEAEEALRRFAALRPDEPEELSNLGYAVQQQGRLQEAEDLFRRALELAKGRNPALYHNLCGILDMQGKSEEARAEYRKALQDSPLLWTTELGIAVNLIQRGKRESGERILQDILAARPSQPEVWNDVGAMLIGLGKHDEAVKKLHRAIELEPQMAEAHGNLGSALLHAGQAGQAIGAFRRALQCNPAYITAQVNLTRALRQMGQFDEAHIFARSALDMPGYVAEHMPILLQIFKGLCDFEALDRIGDVWAGCDAQKMTHLTALFLDLLVFARTREETKKFVALTRKWGDTAEDQASSGPLTAPRPAAPDSRLRVGLLSADLRAHSVSRFLLPLVLKHDKSNISLHCYTPFRQKGDAVQEQFRKAADGFTFVENMTEREIAEAIRADGIDILLELNGFTQGTRIGALAYKPAPVQMSWLGYPFTSGLKAIDYVVMDRFVLPADESTLVEQPLVMPDAWVCFGKFPEVAITPSLPMERNGFVTFGTLNNPYKYNREVIAAWAAVMQRVPNSRLLIVRPEASSITLIRNLSNEFAKHGIDGERLYFFDNRKERRNHLEYYNEIDISLDSFPLTGGTTTCEATWMGVPVVSLVGEAFHQRISYSALMHCGLEELCTFTVEDFVERAVALVGERDKLAYWRTNLREIMRASPLCDEPRFLHQFQEMLEQVSRLHGLR